MKQSTCINMVIHFNTSIYVVNMHVDVYITSETASTIHCLMSVWSASQQKRPVATLR